MDRSNWRGTSELERERTELMGARADDNDDEGKKEVNLGIGARDHGAVRRD